MDKCEACNAPIPFPKDSIGHAVEDIPEDHPIAFSICELCGVTLIGKANEDNRWMKIEKKLWWINRMANNE